ncbi:uncharacterized protein JCM15063_001200 [Sporobolomyces koalae]|uniref:uncharacterized protein n=1 Tax=Sporobolomyces koalae TaxID=500713 RepID=UPI00316B630E
MTGNLTITGIAAHTAPTGAIGFFSYLRKYRKNKKREHPSSELIYYEGLQIVRKFLEYASTHGVSDLQAFTAAHVPSPTWVYKAVATIPDYNIDRAAELLRTALAMDPKTLALVGGERWWTLRGRALTGEWIEMKKDRLRRGAAPPERVLLYLHGGAHFFSSLETHRYQIQRHARKLGALAFAPSQRLAPQYPFPCALHDAFASYLYLIDPPPDAGHAPIDPSKIIISGDSAGGGLALSLLVLLRDLGLPQPAGATLISPWVDLSHSFPSVNGDDSGDYIPSKGFIYKPDLVWPPPPSRESGLEQVLLGEDGGEVVQLYEQVQMYCPNNMLDHPLISPVNQGSLGGLCPLYIAAGSDELLRDEITYIAHKAANPSAYPPSSDVLAKYPTQRAHLEANYPPTLVQYQLFEGGCHVATTLSVASIAKYIYRGAANAALFYLTAAQTKKDRVKAEGRHSHVHSLQKHLQRGADSPRRKRSSTQERTQASEEHTSQVTTSAVNDDAIVAPAVTSIDLKLANTHVHSHLEDEESSDSASTASTSSDEGEVDPHTTPQPTLANYLDQVIKVTGHLPPFDENHMIRQRVSNHGKTRPLEPASELPGCQMNPEHIGKVHAGPVRKWLHKRAEWDRKYSSELEKFRHIRSTDRVKAQENGFLLGRFKGENPPLCSLAGFSDPELAQQAGESVDEVVGKKAAASMALAFWSKVSSGPDESKAGDEKVKEVEQEIQEEEAKEDAMPAAA